MRTIDSIIIHCSATPYGKEFTAADIDRWHRQRSFNGIGYHFVIRLDGTIENGRPIEKPGAHCIGWNNRSIGICYIGGLDSCGRPTDTRTPAQKAAMAQLINRLQHENLGIRTILGHRDTSPDLNGNGQIEPDEYIKTCPCFDVRTWLRNLSLTGVYTGLFLLTMACGSHKSTQLATEKTNTSITSQTKLKTQQESDRQISQKMASDSSTLNQNLTEEYMKQTTIIHYKKQDLLATGKKNKETKADMTTMNAHKTDEKADTTVQIMQQQKQKEKQANTGYATLWIIGGGATGSLLLFRRIQKIRKNRPPQC